MYSDGTGPELYQIVRRSSIEGWEDLAECQQVYSVWQKGDAAAWRFDQAGYHQVRFLIDSIGGGCIRQKRTQG